MALLVSPSHGSAHIYPQTANLFASAQLNYPFTNCTIAVPQRSILGPVLFSVYLYPIAQIASAFGLSQQQYADDTQLYLAMLKQSQDTAVYAGRVSVRTPNLCATVSVTVMPSFSDITDDSMIMQPHSFETDRSRTPLFHVVLY